MTGSKLLLCLGAKCTKVPILGRAFTRWQFPISKPQGALSRQCNTPCTTFFNMTSNLPVLPLYMVMMKHSSHWAPVLAWHV